ncbi:AN1-type zinc finger protein 1 [Biomphalaria pfeifferi]|uniref:AN1-type zinc finger protein 1 n=1 Tax=Biomphalaria pfeifferi TaxID=112525 RepID=A0AAD8EVM4_BIOPF|nr:AN1-type zinc finger protein 1 [Biomphalaria pfeifferi]
MELPHLGANCNVESCNQLDFLPFQCDGCGKIFCQHHRSRDQHNCTAPEIQLPEFKGEKSYACSIKECQRRELTPIVCQHCELCFCLSHRLQNDHNCVKLPEKCAKTKTAEHIQQLIAQSKPKPRPILTNPKAIQMNAKIALMKLKGKAAGDKGISQSDRIYFSVCLPLDVKKPPCAFFVSQSWKIGRVIDFIADQAFITNKNNTNAEKKLCLFHGDTGVKFPASETIQDIMSTDYLLLNGSTVILEQVSEDVEQLETLDVYKSF